MIILPCYDKIYRISPNRKETIMNKKTIAIVFGGQSSEHEISCLSAQTVINNIDREAYEPLLIGITREGRWLLVNSVEQIADGSWTESTVEAIIAPDASLHGAIICENDRTRVVRVDAAFPVLHGKYGEDGTMQGLLELAHIPYVGCGVLASSVGMDKAYTKVVVDRLGIRQAVWEEVRRRELSDRDAVVARIEARLSYPVFVKPANAGSSKGVSKAADRADLIKALQVAAAEDRKILVEETIVGRELECAVYRGKDKTQAASVGEILAADEFYSYDAKYTNAESKTVIDPELPEGKREEIRKKAVAIFDAIDGFGLSRVDFFMEKGTNDIVFNEINTIPGFTSISMYPMLWAAAGRPVGQLVTDLIESAFARE